MTAVAFNGAVIDDVSKPVLSLGQFSLLGIAFLGGSIGVFIGFILISLSSPTGNKGHLTADINENLPLHTAVWPIKKVPESETSRLERLEIPKLMASNVENTISIPIVAQPVNLQKVAGKASSEDVHAVKAKHIHSRRKNVGSPIPTDDSIEIPSKVRLIESIRTDPKRIYVEDTLQYNKVTFGISNISPKFGVEIWVRADDYVPSIIYFPKARIGNVEGSFEGQMLSAGQKFFGTIPLLGLNSKTKVDVYFSAANVPERKVTVKLEW